jgi:hypothetical protein
MAQSEVHGIAINDEQFMSGKAFVSAIAREGELLYTSFKVSAIDLSAWSATFAVDATDTAQSRPLRALLCPMGQVEEVEDAGMRERVFADLQPTQPFVVESETAAGAPEERETIVWLQTMGVMSHAHYDPLHNLFTQV